VSIGGSFVRKVVGIRHKVEVGGHDSNDCCLNV
jgi:hypothetical protein